MHNSGKRLTYISLIFFASALLFIPMADLAFYNVEPWAELNRMWQGLLHPSFHSGTLLLTALGQTIAFALLAVAGSSVIGLGLALIFSFRAIRMACAASRAVHELFWGLIFMQIFGLSAVTGLLAILVPFTGTFAKVYSEIFEQQTTLPLKTIARSSNRLSLYCYTLLPQAWPALASYTRYRFECALRSSTLLGFIGLPTLGFHLETAFKQGQYSEAAAMLLLFFVVIASIKFWFRPRFTVLYLIAAFWLLPDSPAIQSSAWQFISQDIWPLALRQGDWVSTITWYRHQLSAVALPAVIDTILLSQLALVLSGIIALCSYGWASRNLVRGSFHRIGQLLLLVMRSTPEIVLAFIFLLILGPSGLPVVLALALHNGGLVAFLIANQSEHLTLRLDAPKGINRFFYELTPRLYSHMLALLLYRWEVILRESAILGILGVTTLGFYIDSAFEDIRYDRAAFLIFIAALLNLIVDSFARRIRRYGQLPAVK